MWLSGMVGVHVAGGCSACPDMCLQCLARYEMHRQHGPAAQSFTGVGLVVVTCVWHSSVQWDSAYR